MSVETAACWVACLLFCARLARDKDTTRELETGGCLALATVLVILATLLADTFVLGFDFLAAAFGPPDDVLPGFWLAVLPLVAPCLGPCVVTVLAALEGCVCFTSSWL